MALLLGRRLLTNRSLLKTPRRHGYIVLVPEIGEDLPEKNPLLQHDGLPQFNNVTIENCMAAIAKQTLQFEADVKHLEVEIDKKKHINILEDVINPLEKYGTTLDMTWGLSKALYLGNSSLMPTKSYMAIHERAKRARASKYNSIPIFKAVSDGQKSEELNEEEKRVVKKYFLEGKLNGLHLANDFKLLLDNNLKKLIQERMNFRIKYEAVTKRFSHKITDYQQMRDFPETIADAMSMNPDGEGPWMVTLQPNIYQHFMEYYPDSLTRWNVWQANVSRGSGYGEKEFETSTNIEEIRFIRREQARLLGYDSFADMSMETKMAGSVENVRDVLQTLLAQAKPAQDKELENLLNFAKERGFTGDRIQLWDVDYWRRKECKTLYDYNEQKLQEYFPLPKVLTGLFELCEKIFNIQIKRRSNISTWHKDVKYYDVFETHSSAPIAGFYFDPYARSNEKQFLRINNGWMVAIQNHSIVAQTKPLAALVFNFEPATTDKPSLLTFNDLKALFHKFGQMLQHVLSRTTYSEVSGLSNVEWDIVDVSGHLLSSWLLNHSTIKQISSHYMSEDPLPLSDFQNLVKAQRHCAGIELCKELYLSHLDLELHSVKDFWLDVVKRSWSDYRTFPLEKIDSHVCNFTQIFLEEWAAAYYSRVWSRMIAADVYSAFHEVQDDERAIIDVGKRYRDTFLAFGGSRYPGQVFRMFRGRDPSPKALIASLGLKQTK